MTPAVLDDVDERVDVDKMLADVFPCSGEECEQSATHIIMCKLCTHATYVCDDHAAKFRATLDHIQSLDGHITCMKCHVVVYPHQDWPEFIGIEPL